MNQDPNYPRFGQQEPQQYGLQSFDSPQRRGGRIQQGGLKEQIMERLGSPVFATAALLLTGVAFAGIIMAVYPGEDSVEAPVVEAETLAFKSAPDDPGGMEIENRDSTIFSAMENGAVDQNARLENLLAEEEPVDKLAAFARQVEETIEKDEQAADGAETPDTSTLVEAAQEPAAATETAPVTLQKIAKQEATETVVAPTPAPKPAEEVAQVVKPKIQHKAGENPETLEFVRSVLDQKDAGTTASASPSDVATQSASIQPAAGNPTRQFSITPGSYYVQLGSVKSLSGAESEWGKIRDEFTAELGSVPHRVETADLGEKGTFYRIQAGPMSKTSASEICDSIKAQKPGGCLVTQ